MAKKRTSERDLLLKKLGARIRDLRIEKGLSQEALALAAGLDRSYVGGVKRGERNIAVLNLSRIAKALDVSLPTLMQNMR